jgi:hypothetical protein
VSTPGGDYTLVFDVTTPADSMKIDMTITEMGMTVPLTAIKHDGKKLSFTFNVMEMGISCAFEKKDDGTYEGPCTDPEGTNVTMKMLPPKKGAPTP